jgi:N-acetyl-gamma-glutamyl-phosphate reductase
MNKQIAVLGASGYTGAELVRLVHAHPNMDITALAADRKAGQSMASVFPHLGHLDLPDLVKIEDIDYSQIDLVFCGLPHGVAHDFVRTVPDHVKIVDLSPDFRLEDGAAYEKWYGGAHKALDLQASAVLGLPEVYRESIKSARIAANTGCFVATSLLPLIPALKGGVIESDPIIIDAKSGVSGAGRGLKEPDALFRSKRRFQILWGCASPSYGGVGSRTFKGGRAKRSAQHSHHIWFP